MNERAVSLCVLGNESKAHRAADGHHQRSVGHRFGEGIQAADEVP